MPMIQLRGVEYKKRRPWGWILLAAVPVLVLLVPAGISVKAGWSLTHPEKLRVTLPAMAQGMKIENVTFPSREDKLQLKGWFLPSPGSQKTVIFVHGYRNNRQQENVPALAVAREIVRKGFNMLLFDLRNSGESQGDLTSVGQFEKRDVLGAVDYVKSRGVQGKHIGLLGFSMGGATAALAAAEATEVEAAVVDAAFADLTAYIREKMPLWSELPDFPFTSMILALIPPVTGTDPGEVSPIQAVGKTVTPMLFIHGKADTTTPYKNSEQLYQAAAAPGKELWLVEGAEHVKSYQVQSKEYIRRVTDFFNKHMGK